MTLGPSTLHRFASDEEWLAWRNEAGCVGGSDLPRLLGLHTFKGTAPASTGAGHTLEPLILARAARIRQWAHVEQGWCVRSAAEPWRRGSLDALVLTTEVNDGRHEPLDRQADSADQGATEGATRPQEEGLPHIRQPIPRAGLSSGRGASLHMPPAAIVVEIKVVFLGQVALWRNGLPDHVLAQALWYQDLTGLPVVVVALLVNAWGATKESAPTIAECSEIRFYDLPVDANAERRALIVETVQRVRDEGLVVPTFVPPPQARPPEGTLDDGVLAAQWLKARADLEAARESKRVATSAAKTATKNLNELSLRLRTRVGPGESMLAGGWRVSVGTNGAIRVR